jgi:hypothetical protein
LKEISKRQTLQDMGRIGARRHIKTFIRSVVLVIVGYVWVLFWFSLLSSITDDPSYSSISHIPWKATFFFVMLMGLAPFGFGLIRLVSEIEYRNH